MVNWINIGVKLFAVAFVVVAFVCKALGVFNVSASDIVMIGGMIVGTFIAVDASKVAKTIKGDS